MEGKDTNRDLKTHRDPVRMEWTQEICTRREEMVWGDGGADKVWEAYVDFEVNVLDAIEDRFTEVFPRSQTFLGCNNTSIAACKAPTAPTTAPPPPPPLSKDAKDNDIKRQKMSPNDAFSPQQSAGNSKEQLDEVTTTLLKHIKDECAR
mmetsp:Transcript_26192/g.51255  ORF Transcript_26192/g.51255 Transcript_26192/m.51255 type:complete len:149 (-) Transcript_26192:324-770(-)